MSSPTPTGSRGPGPSWASDLSSLLGAMRDVHGGILELQAREARLFELVERVTRRLLDEHAAAAAVAAERDPVTPELAAELLGPIARRVADRE